MVSEPEGLSIGFVGGGNVARTLARGFHEAGLRVTAAYSRSAANAESVAMAAEGCAIAATPQAVADAASLVFLTVPDDAIEMVARATRWRPGHFAVHCSGATPLDALASAHEAGAVVGGFHPLQMFADPAAALRSLPGCAVGIEAPEPLASTLTELANSLGCRPFVLPPGVRALYHASANYIGPFVIAILHEATTLWGTFGVAERDAMAAFVPLLRGTIEAALSRGLAGGMGGCVARGDVGTVRKHLQAIDAVSPEMGELYRELTRRTIPLGIERGTLTPERAAAIAAAIEPKAADA